MRRSWLNGILRILGLLVFGFYGILPLLLPAPKEASVPADQFSAERAMRHVVVLAQGPRQAGTMGMERAAGYVAASLRGCGLAPEVQQLPSAKGMLRNTVVHIPGAHSGGALLIVSHIDSISYGAGDNASGAAVLLETACALKAGKRLQNDIILLFEDGEEAGYLGGYAFAATDRSFGPVHAVIGLDTAAWGPAVLLQTTPGNSLLIRAYAASVEKPVAFGFFADADWTISKDTSEIQPFYEKGIPGLEMEDPTAFTGKHSAADRVENVQPGSLQQMGEQVLALARFLGDHDLHEEAESQLSYFTLWGFGLVHYPASWNLGLALATLIGAAVLAAREIKRRLVMPGALLRVTASMLLALIAAAALGVLGNAAFGWLFPNPNPDTGSYLVPATLPAFLTISTLVVVSYHLMRHRLAERFGHQTLELAGAFPWALVAIAASALLPVGSSLLVLPLFATVLVSLLRARQWYVRLVPAAIATILFAPNMLLAYLSTGMQALALVEPLLVMNVELWARSPSGRFHPTQGARQWPF